MKASERFGEAMKKLLGALLFAAIVLSVPLVPLGLIFGYFTVASCVYDSREARGLNDHTYSSFDEYFEERYAHQSIAFRLEHDYGLTLPESAEFLYGRKHSYLRGSEYFFMFRIVPRELPGYSEGLEADSLMRMIADDDYDFSFVDAECAEGGFVSAEEAFELGYIQSYDPDDRKLMWIPSRSPWPCGYWDSPYEPDLGLGAREIEEETMGRAAKYEGEDIRFHHSAPSSHAFRCTLYSTRCTPEEMVFAISYWWD